MFTATMISSRLTTRFQLQSPGHTSWAIAGGASKHAVPKMKRPRSTARTASFDARANLAALVLRSLVGHDLVHPVPEGCRARLRALSNVVIFDARLQMLPDFVAVATWKSTRPLLH